MLIGIIMLYLFFKEAKEEEEEYQKHINVEHNHPV
jgi:hypothetical protein